MASPTLPARLRITSYTPITNGPGGTIGQDLIFRLKAAKTLYDLTDSGKVLVFPSLFSELLVFSIVRYSITVVGVVLENSVAHTAHALSTGVEHDPDYIDMEEACLAWNNQAPATLPQLELRYDGTNWRVYKGVIQTLTLVKNAGHEEVDFSLRFAVEWSSTNPTLREWSS